MQLKMTNKFNVMLVKQLLQEEDRFLGNIFSKMPLPLTESEEYQEANHEEHQPPEKKVKLLFNLNGNLKRAQTSEELYQKLSKLKGQRKLGYKQKQLRKVLKNRIKKKSKREERLMQKKIIKTEKNAAGVISDMKGENQILPQVPRAKPVFNSEGHMVFSKFDFSNIGNKKKIQNGEKDPKKILWQLQEKKQKLKELIDSGEMDKAGEIMEKTSWKTALAKAGGEKVKDDPELLMRTIKREEQMKKRSSKKWESRIAAVEKAKRERQHERHENIVKSKREKKMNKLKKASKKGRIIPGF